MTDQDLLSERIAFLGLGAMGEPMVANLAPAAGDLVLVDALPERAARLATELGVSAAGGPADVADAGVVVLMLPDSVQVDNVLLRSGLLDALRPGSTVIDMGSSQPARTVELAARAARRGIAFVDAPVSGGVGGAKSGTLAIMIGGEESAVERVRPLLSLLGRSLTHVGGPGAGHAMKALNNMLSAAGILAAAEVLAVGVRFGLEPKVMLDVLNGSTGRNQATETKFERYVLSRAFDSGFAMKLMVKDLGTAIELPGATDGATGILSVTRDAWAKALAELGDGADHTELARFVETDTGVELR